MSELIHNQFKKIQFPKEKVEYLKSWYILYLAKVDIWPWSVSQCVRGVMHCGQRYQQFLIFISWKYIASKGSHDKTNTNNITSRQKKLFNYQSLLLAGPSNNIHLHLSRAGWRRWWTIVIVYDNLFHCPSDDVVIVAYNQPFLGRRCIDSVVNS